MAERKTTWVVSELYYPEETSTGYFLTNIAEGLARHRDVSVLCAQPSYSARGVRAPRRETHNGVAIQRCASTTFNKDRLALRAINAATVTSSIFWLTLKNVRRGDSVLVVTNPPMLPFAVSLACRLRGARCLLLIHDVYPEVLTATGLSSETSTLSRMVGAMTRRLYRGVERIIVLGRDMERLARRKLPPGDDRVVIIPNWGDIDEIRPQPRETNALLRELGLQDKFIVQYAGNMGRTHGLETLVAAAERLKGDGRIRFLCSGSGAKRAWLEQTARERSLENMTVLTPRPRAELANLLNACDVSVISFVPGMAGVSVPSRMYNAMAAGRALLAICDPDSELALVVEEEDAGWVLPPGDVDALVRTLQRICAEPEAVRRKGENARRAAERYSLAHVIEKYEDLLRGMETDSAEHDYAAAEKR